MSRTFKTLVLALALAAQLAAGVAIGAGQASAATGPGDDRQLTAPARWWTYTGVTASRVSALARANHARLTDIQVDNPAVPTFTVVMVGNSGAYASGWWWYYGQTAGQVSSRLRASNARLISAQAYQTSRGTRFAVVMVPNTGANGKAWWWYYHSTPSFIAGRLAANHARLIGLTPYPGSGRYLAIMVNNTGSNATGWWWYYHATTSFISGRLRANHARLIDLSENGDRTYNVVMYRNPGIRWYWYIRQNLATAVRRSLQQGERIIDVYRYGSTYSVVETRNPAH